MRWGYFSDVHLQQNEHWKLGCSFWEICGKWSPWCSWWIFYDSWVVLNQSIPCPCCCAWRSKRTPAWEATHFGVRYNLWVMGTILIGTISRNFQLINCRVSVSTRQTLLPVSCRSLVGRVLLEYPRCRSTLPTEYLINDPNSPRLPTFQCHTQGQWWFSRSTTWDGS